MSSNKRVLLIAGGGTLGTYVSEELLRLGASVEVICPEEKVSDNERLVFHQSLATEELLRDLFPKNTITESSISSIIPTRRNIKGSIRFSSKTRTT